MGVGKGEMGSLEALVWKRDWGVFGECVVMGS